MKTTVTNTTLNAPLHSHCVCWSAIIAGALVALGLGFLLQLFGIAMGLTAYHSTAANSSTLAIGAYIGLVIGAIVSMGVAGYVAGYLGRYVFYYPGESSIYGFLTWCLALVLSAFLIMPLSHYTATSSDRLSSNVVVTDQQSDSVRVGKKSDATTRDENSVANTQVKMTPEAVTQSFWLLFILFFIGAFSSCIGSYLGMHINRRHYTVVEIR